MSKYMTINYAMISKSKDMLSVTRLLASEMQLTPYLNVGDFIKDLTNEDLEVLCEACEHAEDLDGRFSELILIAEMLSAAEGLPAEYEEEDDLIDLSRERVGLLITFLTVESLKRKGLVKVFYENMSFDVTSEKVIVQKI